MKTHRRTVAAIADAAATLARTIVRLRRLDPDLIAPHVADRTDLRAVLGRGRWLPTMTRHVPLTDGPVDLGTLLAIVAPPRPVPRRLTRRRVTTPGQSPLFAPGEVGTECR